MKRKHQPPSTRLDSFQRKISFDLVVKYGSIAIVRDSVENKKWVFDLKIPFHNMKYKTKEIIKDEA